MSLKGRDLEGNENTSPFWASVSSSRHPEGLPELWTQTMLPGVPGLPRGAQGATAEGGRAAGL